MMKMLPKTKCERIIALSLLLISAYSSHVSAQIIKRRTAKDTEIAPKTILVMLPSYTRRAAYLKANPAKLQQLEKDRDSMMHKISMDFNDNFTFAPVYYFADSNRDRIARGEFEEVLLDAALLPARNIQVGEPYQIVYFGYPAANTQSANGNDGDILSGNQTNAGSQRLVVLDSDMAEVRKPLPNGGNNTIGGKMEKDKNEYRYTSPKFDIYYRPSAKNLSAKMEKFYRNQRSQ